MRKVAKIYFKVERGEMQEIRSKDELLAGDSFEKKESVVYDAGKHIAANSGV